MVDLEILGYTWTCPNCDSLNYEPFITASVICSECHHTFNAREET